MIDDFRQRISATVWLLVLPNDKCMWHVYVGPCHVGTLALLGAANATEYKYAFLYHGVTRTGSKGSRRWEFNSDASLTPLVELIERSA